MKEKEFCSNCSSKLIKKFVEGRERLFCNNCEEVTYQNPIPATTGVYFNEKEEVLLVKRAKEPSKGEWCLPGGFQEIDETPLEGLKREFKEETDLDIANAFPLSTFMSPNPFYKNVLLQGFFVESLKEGIAKAGDDALELNFFKLSELPPLAFKSHQKVLDQALWRISKGVHAKFIKSKMLHPFGAYMISDEVESCLKACDAGVKILQLRDKRSNKAEVLKKAKIISSYAQERGVIFVVNDYLDIALACNASGVHVGQDDFPIEEIRKIVPSGFIVGVSTHSYAQAMEAEKRGADYIGIGPVFETPTKEHYQPIGLDVVSKVIKDINIPYVAIGGINRENLSLLKQINAVNVAMVRDFAVDTKERILEVNNKLLN